MKHEFYLDEYGEVDIWRVDYEYHNGPACKNCHVAWCHHCSPKIYEEECVGANPFPGNGSVS